MNQEVQVKIPTKVWIAILILVLTSVSCKFFSAKTPEPTPEPYIFTPYPSLEIKPDRLPDGQTGTPYDAIIRIGNVKTAVGDVVVDKGDLPPGLALKKDLENSSVSISGTPQEAGTYSFLLRVWCYGTNIAGQTGEIKYSITVK